MSAGNLAESETVAAGGPRWHRS